MLTTDVDVTVQSMPLEALRHTRCHNDSFLETRDYSSTFNGEFYTKGLVHGSLLFRGGKYKKFVMESLHQTLKSFSYMEYWSCLQ